MAGAQFEYDERGGTSYYFLISFYAIVLIPVTYYFFPKRKDKDKSSNLAKCHCDGCEYKESKTKLKQPWGNLKHRLVQLAIILAWLGFVLLSYKVSHIEADHVEYDPFAVLGLDRGASDSEIKKAYRKLSKIHHPDRGGDPKTFVALTKAHQALTNEESKENFEKYGNPDGPGERIGAGELPLEVLSEHSDRIETLTTPLRDRMPIGSYVVSPLERSQHEKEFILQILIKCADINNPCRSWKLSQEWSFRASTEFFKQGDLERRLGLPVTSFCDRYATSVSKIQSGFMEFVAQPLFSDWDQYIRSPLSAVQLANLRSNCEHWTQILQSEVDLGTVSPTPRLPIAHRAAPTSMTSSVAATSSVEDAASIEAQSPETLRRRRRVSAAAVLVTPFRRSSLLPFSSSPERNSFLRRISLPTSSTTLWTVRTQGRGVLEAHSVDSLGSEPISLHLPAHSASGDFSSLWSSGISRPSPLIELPEVTVSPPDSARTGGQISARLDRRPAPSCGSGTGKDCDDETYFEDPEQPGLARSAREDYSSANCDSAVSEDYVEPETLEASEERRLAQSMREESGKRRFSEPLLPTLAALRHAASVTSRAAPRAPNVRRGSLPIASHQPEQLDLFRFGDRAMFAAQGSSASSGAELPQMVEASG